MKVKGECLNPSNYLLIFVLCVLITQITSYLGFEYFEKHGRIDNPLYQLVTSIALISVFIGANSFMSLALKVEKQNND